MAILPIRCYPDPVLTEVCRDIETVDRALVERGTLYTIEAVEPPKPMKGGEANGR